MKRITFFTILLVLCSSLVLFAAGTQETPAGYSSEDRRDVEILIWWAKKFSDEDALIDYVGNLFNSNLTISTIPHNVYFDQLNVKIAANDLPPAYKIQIPNTFGFRQLYELTEDGIIDELSSLAKKYNLKHLSAYLSQSELDHLRTSDGGIYISPILQGPSTGLYVRMDWLKRLGLDVPKNWDEMYTVLKAFKEANLSGKVVAPLGGGSVIDRIIESYTGGYRNGGAVAIENGKPVHITQHSQYKNAVKYINKLYTEGLLHPTSISAAATGPTEYMRQFSDGNIGILAHVALPGHWKSIETPLKQNYPNSDLGFITPLPAGIDGNAYLGAGAGYYGGIVINSDADDDMKRRVLSILDYLMSEEGNNILYDGIEGIHYTMGNSIKVVNEETRARDFVGSVSNLIDLVDRSGAWDREENLILKENYMKNLSLSVPMATLGLSTEIYVEAESSTREVMNNYLPKFYTGELNIDANWDRMMKDLESAGLSAMMKEVRTFLK